MRINHLFDVLFGPTPSHRPVRRDAHVQVTFDCDGNPVVEPDHGEAFLLSRDGSIDRIHVAQDRFYHCGCSTRVPLGGMCSEQGCGRLSCARCFDRCGVCKKPVCLEHSRYLDADGFRGQRFCMDCFDATRRRLMLRRTAQGVANGVIRLLDTMRRWA